jgi:dipeptidyl-peptidase-4
VVFEHSSALIARLQAGATPFEMMLYPGHTHRITGPQIGKHLYETMFRFLASKAPEPRAIRSGKMPPP